MSYQKKLNIGLFGFGVVGEGIYNVLKDTPSLNAEVRKICIKDPLKKRNAPSSLFTIDSSALLEDDEINVIVELIDDADAAFEIIARSLRKGKAVVSANKKCIAHHLDELLALQKKYNTPLLYEASVCGSVPIIRNLEEYYDNDLLNSFEGIVNGSTNYILTKISEGVSYEQALKQAQDAGFAESDPFLDVEGKDAVNKLTIVLHHAYGIIARPEDILHKGITRISDQDALYAREKGREIKLVAQARITGENKVSAWVLPKFVKPASQLYTVRNEYNGVLLGSRLSDLQFLYGKGAGRYPTSSAVLSDISALRYDYRYEYRKSFTSDNHLVNDGWVHVYVSYPSDFEIPERDFYLVDESFKGRNGSYLTGIINPGKLKKAAWFYDRKVSVILIDEADPESLRVARASESFQLQ